MSHKKFIVITIFAGIVSGLYASIPYTLSYTVISEANTDVPAEEKYFAETKATPEQLTERNEDIPETNTQKTKLIEAVPIVAKKYVPDVTKPDVFNVPFYSQFTDITAISWKKIGCGIASLAMLIDFYEPGEVTVDELLQEGISANAYLSDAGWSHAGLIGLSKKHGLTGESRDMAGQSMESAFDNLKTVVAEGPVMVSVHYTFDPKNPIPHLVVVNGVSDGLVHYNDPADTEGDGTISIAQFQSAWKKRYIEIRPS